MASNISTEHEVPTADSHTTDVNLITQSKCGSGDIADAEIMLKSTTDNGAEKLMSLNINETDGIRPEEAVRPLENRTDASENQDTEPGDGANKSQLLNQKFELIAKYMDLAANKKRHSYLLAEQTISGFLVLCLGDEDLRIVERSMAVFMTFGKHPENISALQELKFLQDALRCVARNPEIQDDVKYEARKLAKKLLPVPLISQPLAEVSDSTKNIEAGTSMNGKDIINQLQKPADLNTTMSTMKRKNKGRETILLVENNVLQQRTERTKITQALISVPGIISVTYDIKRNYCIVRGKRNVPSEHFGRAVAVLRVADVFVVRKNESGDEVKVPVPSDDQENNIQYPLYPEEVENEDKDESRSVAKTGQHNAEDSSFLKSARNFLKRSFYW
ncbi:unnamed protein product [Orchesella dallaii]|uniref:Armadillo repeat-containing protein 1 n=1 Tax=Orchesella dallaii TaxID=48710 RepID=A0ABP1RNI9_9HEXA